MVRRVYTATGSDGRSYVAQDAEAGAVHGLADAGLTFHELWRTAGPLADIDGASDPVGAELEILPEPGGTALRVVELAPTHAGAVNELHESPTTDYNMIIAGEVVALSETGEVLLRTGDVIVQRGGRHGWRNDSTQTCIFASVMVNDR